MTTELIKFKTPAEVIQWFYEHTTLMPEVNEHLEGVIEVGSDGAVSFTTSVQDFICRAAGNTPANVLRAMIEIIDTFGGGFPFNLVFSSSDTIELAAPPRSDAITNIESLLETGTVIDPQRCFWFSAATPQPMNINQDCKHIDGLVSGNKEEVERFEKVTAVFSFIRYRINKRVNNDTDWKTAIAFIGSDVANSGCVDKVTLVSEYREEIRSQVHLLDPQFSHVLAHNKNIHQIMIKLYFPFALRGMEVHDMIDVNKEEAEKTGIGVVYSSMGSLGPYVGLYFSTQKQNITQIKLIRVLKSINAAFVVKPETPQELVDLKNQILKSIFSVG